MRKFFLLFLLLMFILAGLSAQSTDTQTGLWYMGKPIKEIKFEGLNHIRLSDLESVTSQFIGTAYSPGVYRDLQSKLFALDYFKKFTAEAEPSDNRSKVIIVFTVEERPLVDDIEIVGNKKVSKGDIFDSILLKRDDIFSSTKMRYDEDAIVDLYLSKGFTDVTVESESEDLEDNTVKVTFTVNEGNQTRISEIKFSGNSVFSDSTLKGELESKEQSLLSSGIFEENKIESDKQAIEFYYQNRGYIDVNVTDIKREVTESEKGRTYLALTFFIEEGDQWTFGGLDIQGNKIFTTEELLELLTHEPGDIINKSRLDLDFSRLSDLYYNDGYIYNDIKLSESRNDTDHVVNYSLSIVERGRAHIEDIIIKGNKKTKDYVIYREIPLQSGDIFSKEKVLAGIQNLYNTGLFSTVAPETPYGSADGLMDLVINVEEGKNTDIQFGVTFTGSSGEFPMAGFLKWNDNNFRGRGETLSIGTEISTTTQSVDLGFKENWLMGKRWSAGVNFSFERKLYSNVLQDFLPVRFTDEDYDNDNAAPDPYNSYEEYEAAVDDGESIDPAYLMQYRNILFSLGGNTGYTFHTDLGRFTTSTGLVSSLTKVEYDETQYRPYNPAIRDNLDVWLLKNRLWVNLVWDKRDFINNPNKGFLLNQITTYSGGFLGGSTHYVKSQSKAEAYLKLLDIPRKENKSFKTILAAHTAFSMVLPQYYHSDDSGWTTGIEATTSDLLYTDGMNIARGWDYMQDGEAMWDNWVELRIPISENVIWWDFFFSGTGFWKDRTQVSNMSINDFKFAFGGGMRLTIPGLPIGLYFTKGFSFIDDTFTWKEGDIFKNDDPNSGIDLVIAFQTGLF